MIVNFWVYVSPIMRTQVEGVLMIPTDPPAPGQINTPEKILATTFQALNSLEEATEKMLRYFPERGSQIMPDGLWNVYARGDGLHSFVDIREDLQKLEDKYYPDFWVGGAWSYADGEPIGGVGSPWFTYPGDLLSILPDNLLQQIVLMAGQAKRKFI